MAEEQWKKDDLPVENSDESILSGLQDELKVNGSFVTNLGGQEDCGAQYDRWLAVTERFLREIPLMRDDANKETAINQILSFCDQVSRTKITYQEGESEDGTPALKTYAPSKSRIQMLRNKKEAFVLMFNSLPSRLALSEKLNAELDEANYTVNRLKAAVRDLKDRFKSAEKTFWAENPDVLNRKREVKIRSYILLSVGAILTILLGAIAALRNIVWLYLAALAVLALTFFIRKKNVDHSVLKIKEECFPQELKDIEAQLKEDQTELETAAQRQVKAQEAVSAFEATRK